MLYSQNIFSDNTVWVVWQLFNNFEIYNCNHIIQITKGPLTRRLRLFRLFVDKYVGHNCLNAFKGISYLTLQMAKYKTRIHTQHGRAACHSSRHPECYSPMQRAHLYSRCYFWEIWSMPDKHTGKQVITVYYFRMQILISI